jgi:hypothetical protein
MNNFNKLFKEILSDRQLISNTLAKLQIALEHKEEIKNIDDFLALTPIATALEDIYTATENIIKRILKFRNISTADSKSIHKEILDLAVKEGIISFELCSQLDEYRRFRHASRWGYGVTLREKDLMPLAEKLPDVWKKFESELDIFIQVLTQQETK